MVVFTQNISREKEDNLIKGTKVVKERNKENMKDLRWKSAEEEK